MQSHYLVLASLVLAASGQKEWPASQNEWRQAQASRNSIRKPQHFYDASMTAVSSEGPVNNTEKSPKTIRKPQQFDLIDDSSMSTPKSPSQSVADSFEGMVNNTDGVVFDAPLDSEMQTAVKVHHHGRSLRKS
mmetsp:Transcript_63928/g.169190  ORF Transcript_63928/g.169190 Transcript_63928/m.169190 type:complete len:133 (-) Transcript_63928:105-503(-)|eukprot:CAMPEP_0194480084 /NCGR_PEP_ID=MMETSP0253-20130528/3012_1 /TAXON_ID=2966 /ORGANISM="Noctiluca scintillans" /LENGTH=132 /DNA_ID=CAMNT_0039319415 /DNA_START=54 /DNA_END=452 /DNA_ORIENTATION=+